MLLGFIGAGGAGVLVALLTTAFGLEIHTAIGTALAAMCVLTITGAISHFREGNVAPRVAVIVGLSGSSAPLLAPSSARTCLNIRSRSWPGSRSGCSHSWSGSAPASHVVDGTADPRLAGRSTREVASSIGLGVSGGVASAFFGVGMTPYIQLGMLSALKLPLRITVGTTMTTLVFISAGGAAALARNGDVSANHLIRSIVGLSVGSWFGAKLTRRLSPGILRNTIAIVPFIAGSMLLFL